MHVSPSQIATWRNCQRKWAYSRTRPRTANKYAEFGTEVHRQREQWLTSGTPPDTNTPEGRCAMAGLELLPMPGTCLVEEHIDFNYLDVDYKGFADAIDPATGTVHDHKTCGSFDYCLTEDGLRDDPQRIIYSFWAANVLEQSHVTATWHYLRRNPPECRPVSITQDLQSIEAAFINLHERYSLSIVEAADKPPEELPRNLSHCGAYGGCPYAEECLADVSPMQRAAAAMQRSKNTMSEVPEQVLKLIANPPPGLDIDAIKKHYGIVEEAPADPRPAEKQAPKKRKPRSDKGQPRKVKVETTVFPPATARRGEAPRNFDSTKLLECCAMGGLSLDDAKAYLELAKGL